MKRGLATAGAGGVLLVFVSPAWADGGTPLMLTSAAHLLLGNALIGVLEGLLVAWLFKVPRWRAMGIMVLANYVSMIAGIASTQVARPSIRPLVVGDEPVYHVWRMIPVMLGLTFLVTIMLEWPFCYWAMKSPQRRARRSFRASLAAQTASYLVLVPVYLSVSQAGLIWDLDSDRELVSRTGNDATIFYLSNDGNALYRIGLNGSGREKLRDLPMEGRLLLRRSGDSDDWDLLVEKRGTAELLIARLARAVFPGSQHPAEPGHHEIVPYWYGPAYDLRPPGARNWRVSRGHWSAVHASDQRTGERIRISMEIPYESWATEAPSVLPGDRVVFGFGGSIMLVDLNSRRIGQIASGRNPITILNKSLCRPNEYEATVSATKGQGQAPPNALRAERAGTLQCGFLSLRQVDFAPAR